jgi:mono/diheme cytochrome c family protein
MSGENEQGQEKRSWLKIGAITIGGLVAIAGLGVAGAFGVTSSRMNKTYDIDPVPLKVKPSPDLVERGKELATFRGCRDCHGKDLAGRLVGDNMPVMRLAGPNITPGGAVEDYTDEDWARAIRHGIGADGKPLRFMPSYEWTELSHRDLAAIISYARSVEAKPDAVEKGFAVGPVGRLLYLAGELPLLPVEMIDHDAKPASPERGPTAAYGQYLSSACTGCHGMGLSGGKIPGVPPDWPAASNLTAHESGLKDWSFEDFETALRTGKRPDGSTINEQYMPWKLIRESSDEDIRALWKYTRKVDPKPTGNR